MSPLSARDAKAWSLNEMIGHFASLKADDYGELQTAEIMEATTDHIRLWFPFQQKDVQFGNFEISLVFDDQVESSGITPYGRYDEMFKDFSLNLAY